MINFLRVDNHLINEQYICGVNENFHLSMAEGGGSCVRLYIDTQANNALPPYVDVVDKEARQEWDRFSRQLSIVDLSNPAQTRRTQTAGAGNSPSPGTPWQGRTAGGNRTGRAQRNRGGRKTATAASATA